jgi:serine/threonine protein phosphatase PrpC
MVLLCSDGVWSVLHAASLEHLIRSAGPEPPAICAAVLLAVLKRGSTDPMSIMVVSCHHHHLKIAPGVKQARGKH